MRQFVNEEGKVVKFNLQEPFDMGLCGKIYMFNSLECLKLFNNNHTADDQVIALIKELNLNGFTSIHNLLYSRYSKLFKGYTMDYIKKSEIDILTMPSTYTLDSLFTLYQSFLKLTRNNVFISDVHEDNVIMNENGLTMIDFDLYTINKFFEPQVLERKNIRACLCLFRDLYYTALEKYHSNLNGYQSSLIISSLFESLYQNNGMEKICKKLVKYKYPIDYITK